MISIIISQIFFLFNPKNQLRVERKEAESRELKAESRELKAESQELKAESREQEICEIKNYSGNSSASNGTLTEGRRVWSGGFILVRSCFPFRNSPVASGFSE